MSQPSKASVRKSAEYWNGAKALCDWCKSELVESLGDVDHDDGTCERFECLSCGHRWHSKTSMADQSTERNQTHTPGPWRCFRTPGKVSMWSIASDNGIVARTPGNGADARLITAAPEMLKLLERWADQLPLGCMHVPTYLVEATTELLRSIAGEPAS